VKRIVTEADQIIGRRLQAMTLLAEPA